MSILDGTILEWQACAIALIKLQKANILVLTGGFGSGKTAVNVHIMKELLASRNMIGISIGYAYPVIKEVLLPTIEEEIPYFYIDDIVRNPVHNFKFRFGDIQSTLLTRTIQYSHEAPKRLKSINADFIHLLEGTELPKEAYNFGVSRLRASGKDAYYPVLIETNPSSKEHWIYKTFIEGSENVYDKKNWWITRKKIGSQNCYTIHTTTFANPFFPKSILEQMKNSYSEAEYQRLVLGEWNALEGRVWEKYYTFKHPQNLMQEYAARYDRIFLGCDPGQSHENAISFIGFKKDTGYEVFDEIYVNHRSIKYVLELIVEKLTSWGLWDGKRHYDLWVEPSGFGLAWQSESYELNKNIHVILSKHRGTDPVLNRVLRIGELLRTKRLTISDFCINHIKDCEQTVYAKDSIKERIDKETHDPHAMDACGYALTQEAF